MESQLTSGTLIADVGTQKINRDQLALIVPPNGTTTFKPVAHIDIVNAVIESLGLRRIGVVADEYAVSRDGMRMFGCLDLEEEFSGCRFSIGLRNSNDRTMRLAMTVGYRVLVCSNMAFKGDFTPVLAKHSKELNLIDVVTLGIDKVQRSFQPLREQVELWQNRAINPDQARLAIYKAFVDTKMGLPMRLLKRVHDAYFTDTRFTKDRVWTIANAFTSALKDLDPLKQFPATAHLGRFLSDYFLGVK